MQPNMMQRNAKHDNTYDSKGYCITQYHPACRYCSHGKILLLSKRSNRYKSNQTQCTHMEGLTHIAYKVVIQVKHSRVKQRENKMLRRSIPEATHL